MQCKSQWQPSKFIYHRGRLIASRNPAEVGYGSRLITDIIAGYYDQNLREYARGRLLDLGCGKVPLYGVYKNFVSENICVDWENTLHKNPHIDKEVDLKNDLPFDSEVFDTIILSDVLEHVPNPEHLWSEMARILAHGGNVIMNTPFLYWLHEQPHDYYRYTEFALRRFVEIAGLQIVELSAIGGAPEVSADIFAKNLVRVPRVGRALASVAQWGTRRFLETNFGRKVSISTKDSFPLGYFLVAEKV